MSLPEDHGIHGRGATPPTLDEGWDVPAYFAAAPVPTVEAPPAVTFPETKKRDAALTSRTTHRFAKERPKFPEPDNVDRKNDWHPEEPGESAEREPGDGPCCLRHLHPIFGLLGFIF